MGSKPGLLGQVSQHQVHEGLVVLGAFPHQPADLPAAFVGGDAVDQRADEHLAPAVAVAAWTNQFLGRAEPGERVDHGDALCPRGRVGSRPASR